MIHKTALFLYNVWAASIFVLVFLLLFPFTLFFLQRRGWVHYAHKINNLWAYIFFALCGISVRVRYDFEPNPKQAYVFCANHFSYLDITVMGIIIKNYFAFVGKSGASKIPIFGYMFSRLHIEVDRADSESRAASLKRSIETLRQGRSITIFPEGGIKSKRPPQMFSPFKNGAFQMAIKQQVPIVPISLLNNHRKMPNKPTLILFPGTIWVIMHQAIPTLGKTANDIENLRKEVFAVMQNSLTTYNISTKPVYENFKTITIY